MSDTTNVVAWRRAPDWRAGIVARSPAMQELLDQVARVAVSTIPVLLEGETGTGKEVIARAIHAASGRVGAFVAVNCGGLPAGLVESELFGHLRGAFTGADRRHDGLFVRAQHGTIFLDEVAELELVTQAKLLRTVEDGVVRAVGATAGVPIDVRLVAASHESLVDAVETRRFRDDLYFRLAGVGLTVPPLRARADDMELLVAQFVREEAGGRTPPAVSPEAWQVLRRRRWPGNVRELRQAIRRAVVMGGSILRPSDFGVDACSSPMRLAHLDEWLAGKTWSDIERDVLRWAIARYGSVRAAAAALQRPSSTLFDRLNRHGIPLPGRRPPSAPPPMTPPTEPPPLLLGTKPRP